MTATNPIRFQPWAIMVVAGILLMLVATFYEHRHSELRHDVSAIERAALKAADVISVRDRAEIHAALRRFEAIERKRVVGP